MRDVMVLGNHNSWTNSQSSDRIVQTKKTTQLEKEEEGNLDHVKDMVNI